MSETLLTASIMIRSPLLEVFDYVANPHHLPEWVPFYSEVSAAPRPFLERRVLEKGDRFTAKLSLFSPMLERMWPLSGPMWPWAGLPVPNIEVCVDDIVHGRRIAYRSNDLGCTTICDFEPSAGRTLFTLTHSLWSMQGLAMNYWTGPMMAFLNDMLRRVLDGLKRRLEGRAVEPEPRIFFSYRRAKARYVGGRIFDALTSEFGAGTVFRDSNSLLAGGDWAADIEKAIQHCQVVVVHIGDGWEQALSERVDTEDGLRDELEAALRERKGNPIRIVPVLTTEDDSINVHKRMSQIEEGLKALGEKAPRLVEKFSSRMQVQQLREDPDFGRDLEQLMRAVWNDFRSLRPA